MTMPTLHVRSVPDDLYDQLRSLARAQQRSLSAQVVSMLEHALEAEAQQQRQAHLLETIRRRRFSPPPEAPDSVELLREDRQR
jgi:plasmid stability protein